MITVDYVWLDGTEFMPQVRAKTRVFAHKTDTIELPKWSFDGGSTNQGTLGDSDRILKPVKLYKNPFKEEGGGYFTLCEVLNPDGTPHSTNTRSKLVEFLDNNPEAKEAWFGFEQEYTLVQPDSTPLVPEGLPQEDFYCGVGTGKVMGRLISEEHLKACSRAGFDLFGTNAEVMLSQWEYQTTPCEALPAADNLWMSRYILDRGGEGANVRISYHPKVYGDMNGAGCHANVSTKETRDNFKGIEEVVKKLGAAHEDLMKAYGQGNELRLTGEYETSSFDTFTSGVGDRGASVRIPAHVAENEKGYVEDRRPASSCDPYLVIYSILKTLY